MSKKSIKIILASGIFYPDVGGPAIHVRKIAENLAQHGYRPVVVAYGDYFGPEIFPFKVIRVSNKLSPFLRRLKYLLIVLKEAVGARVLYAFNLSTAGFPVFLAGKLFHKKIIIRVPGDPIWERIVENGKRRVSFLNYYKEGLYKTDRPWLFKGIKFILPRFDKVVFCNQFLSDIYQKYYGVSAEKISIILNPVSKRGSLPVSRAVEPTVLFAGRFVAYKNLELVVRAFDRVRQKFGKGKLVMIGDGPDKEKLEKIIQALPSAANIKMIPKMNQEKLFEHISSSTVGIGPALTEFNPNFILECLSFGKPVLLSRENGLSIRLPEEFLFDPASDKELVEKLSFFWNADGYKKAMNLLSSLNLNQSWESVTNFHKTLIDSFVKKT